MFKNNFKCTQIYLNLMYDYEKKSILNYKFQTVHLHHFLQGIFSFFLSYKIL